MFAHRLRIGNGGAEESIPFEASVQSGPIVVPIGGVWQAPWNKRVELSVGWITWFSTATLTYTAWSATLVLVFSPNDKNSWMSVTHAHLQ